MDKTLMFYQRCIKQLLSEYETLSTEYSHVKLLFDDAHMNYMALRVGWMNRKRVHLCLVHIAVEDGMVIIQCNNTEDLIASELEELGIPRHKICIGFLPPEVQTFVHHPNYQRELQLA